MTTISFLKSTRRLAAFAFTTALLCGTAAAQNSTPDTLAKIRKSGTITLGVREASGGLSYSPANGEYAGFHVELCRRIVVALEKVVKRKIEIKYQNVTSANRVPLVQNGTVDLECGSTSNTIARGQQVTFAMTTFIEEVRIAVKKTSGITGFDQLGGKVVVLSAGTTSVQHLRKFSQATGIQFRELLGRDHAESFMLLENDRANAFVLDSGILAGAISSSKNPQDYQIVGKPISLDPVALMMAKGDLAFKKVVDDVIKATVRSGELNQMWEKWFLQPIPPSGKAIGLALSPNTKAAWDNPNERPMEVLAAGR